jgi:hypothetical protein
MARKPNPPLPPADSSYLGLDTKGYHVLRWPSRSREGVTHETRIHKDTGLVSCTCPSFTYRSWCGHAAGAWDAVRHHLYPPADPPPADPGGAALAAAVAAGGDRWIVSRSSTRVTLTCAACYGTIRFTSAVSAPSLLIGSEEAAVRWLANGGVCGCGGAALTAAQADLDGETGDWILGGKLSPPPWLVAPGERKRRHDEAMIDLYGG